MTLGEKKAAHCLFAAAGRGIKKYFLLLQTSSFTHNFYAAPRSKRWDESSKHAVRKRITWKLISLMKVMKPGRQQRCRVIVSHDLGLGFVFLPDNRVKDATFKPPRIQPSPRQALAEEGPAEGGSPQEVRWGPPLGPRPLGPVGLCCKHAPRLSASIFPAPCQPSIAASTDQPAEMLISSYHYLAV